MMPKEDVPTPLGESALRRQVILVAPVSVPRHPVLHLISKVTRLLVDLTGRRRRGEPRAARFREFLEEMGGLWVKMGQLLAMRRDIFPPNFCAELSRLQDRAQGFPVEMVRRIIEEDLGRAVDEIFDVFDDAPIAAASIGQIHRARLRKEGVWVAVKVQRPNIIEVFARDLHSIRKLVGFLRILKWKEQFNLDEMLWELVQAFEEELDYRIEASSISRMRKDLKDHDIYVPKIFQKQCARRVLTMEFIEGVFMAEYIKVREEDPARLRAWLTENDIDPAKVGRRLQLSLMRQIFEDNLFHGDLHPGNILLLRDSKIALIDFGSVGSLESEYRRRYFLLNKAMADRDYEKVADVFLLFCPRPPPSLRVDFIKSQIVRVLRNSSVKAYAKNMTYHEKSMGGAMLEVAKSLGGSKLPVSWTFMRLDRAHLTLDASLMYLLPEVNYIKLGHRYLQEAGERAAEKGGGVLDLVRAASNLGPTIKTVPTFIAEQVAVFGEASRSGAQVFRASKSKAAQLMEVAASLVLQLGVVLWAILFMAFIGQHVPKVLLHAHVSRFTELISVLPRLGITSWLLLLAADAYVTWRVAKLRRRFGDEDSRVPA